MKPFTLRRQWSRPASHRLFPATFTLEECRDIVGRYGGIEATRAIHGEGANRSRDTDVRWIHTNDSSADWIFAKLAQTIALWNSDGLEFDIVECEGLQLACYGPDQLYSWHHDFGPTADTWRKLSIVAMMSIPEECQGGRLQFVGENDLFHYDFNIGDAVVFPSWMKHCVTPVTAGSRWSLTTWFRGPPFR